MHLLAASPPRELPPGCCVTRSPSNKGRLPELIPVRYGRMIQSPFVFFHGAACDEKSIVVDSMPLKIEPHRQPLLIDKVSNAGQQPIAKRIDLNFGSKNRRKHKFHAWNPVKPLYHSWARALLSREWLNHGQSFPLQSITSSIWLIGISPGSSFDSPCAGPSGWDKCSGCLVT
jgi:hypothetical protein